MKPSEKMLHLNFKEGKCIALSSEGSLLAIAESNEVLYGEWQKCMKSPDCKSEGYMFCIDFTPDG